MKRREGGGLTKRLQPRGFPPPQGDWTVPLEYLSSYKQGSEEGTRRPPPQISMLPFGGSWAYVGPFFVFFRIFFVVFKCLKSSLHFVSIFFDFLMILGGFGEDFGKVLGEFFKDFSHFLRKRRSSKFVRPRSVS